MLLTFCPWHEKRGFCYYCVRLKFVTESAVLSLCSCRDKTGPVRYCDYAAGASSQCYWDELMLLKCEFMLLKC